MSNALLRGLTIIQALAACILIESSRRDAFFSALTHYTDSISFTIKNEGNAKAVEIFKEYHLIAKKIALKDNFTPVPFRKSDKEGIPRVLSPLVTFLRGTPDEIRLALTVCRVVEILHLKPSVNLKVLTDPGPDLNKEFENDFRSGLKPGIKKTFGAIRFDQLEKPYGRLVRGPNGPAILTSHYDAQAIIQDPHLLKAMGSLGAITAPWVVPGLMKVANLTVPSKDYRHSRVALLSESAGKTRMIAIGDYGSQLILKPLHDVIMQKLRKMETDGTYDQDSQATRVARMTGSESYSYDLSNATDRFPIEIQRGLISEIIGDTASRHGVSVMVDRDFDVNGQRVRWAVGQPLGFYSSGATFALTHHAIIEYAAFKEGFKSFREYSVLGDDVVIHNTKVATRYTQIMDLIGVKINKAKSVISDGNSKRSEFAKRIFLNGIELSGLKADIVVAAGRSLYMIPDLLRVCKLRGGEVDSKRFWLPSLRNKGSELLSILLAWYSQDLAPFQGNLVQGFSLEELGRETLRLRVNRLKAKADSIEKVLMDNKPIEQLFARGGITFSSKLLGLEGYSDIFSLHPIVGEINAKGEAYFMSLDSLSSLQHYEGDNYPEVCDVEYVPNLLTTVYFGQAHHLRQRYLSSVVIEAYFKIKASGGKTGGTPA